ncbi:pilin [bacterium]|jgi:hypothetical protein|nr:pilin [bacterium]
MNKKAATFLFSLLGIFFISPAFAIDYPTIAGITITESTSAATFIVYFFNLAIAVGTFIAAIVLIMAGIDYVSSRGEPAKIDSAKNKIKNAFLGLIILFASFMILNIINPQLNIIKINELKNEVEPEIIIPEGTGVYLYDSPNYISDTLTPLRVTGTKANFNNENFNNMTQSIKFVNPDGGDFKFGAILFSKYVGSGSGTDIGSGYDLRGNCSYSFNSIPDLSVSVGNENKPVIGNNNLSSIIVFKTKTGSASVTVYNSIDCTKGTEEFEELKDEEVMCTISGGSGFKNFSEACPDFKGNIVSIKTSGDVGVLFKTAKSDSVGRCQYFESNKSGCINTVKHSYAFNIDRYEYEPNVYPQSFMLFPLAK